MDPQYRICGCGGPEMSAAYEGDCYLCQEAAVLSAALKEAWLLAHESRGGSRDDDVESALRRADKAMRSARQSIRNMSKTL